MPLGEKNDGCLHKSEDLSDHQARFLTNIRLRAA